MLQVNGRLLKTPSSMTWGLQDLSSEDTGRTLDGKMHKDRVSQKRTLDCTWNNPTQSEASQILQAVNEKIFMDITYPDAMSGTYQTRTFYVGDRTAPFKTWTVKQKIFSSISFNFIEQ